MYLDKISFFFFLLILFTVSGCKKSQNESKQVTNEFKSFSCDVEKLSEDRQHIISTKNELALDEPYRRSDSMAHSGRYSLLLTKNAPYGFTFEIFNVKKNEIITAAFWSYGKSLPVIVFTDKTDEFYLAKNFVIETDKEGWNKIGYKIYAPGNLRNNMLRIYVWIPTGDTTFVDDFSFTRRELVKREIPSNMLVDILVDSVSWQKLANKRDEAFKEKVLESHDTDYVKIKYVYQGDTLKGHMRLKGDGLDHLMGDKWSFRIKLKSKYSWKGMKTFSIQNPNSRDFLSEWVAHELYKNTDVLAPRYGFIYVEINGMDMGVYAYEEHFDKYLLESNKRREGPIVKFSEKQFWYNNKLNDQDTISYRLPSWEVCPILPFKSNRIAKSQTLLPQFEIAENLMLMYRNWNPDLDDIFDLDKLARYMAVTNITKGYHALLWHNQRFYFNPVECKLEPIAYDCYTSDGVAEWIVTAINGKPDYIDAHFNNRVDLMNQYFLDPEFRKLYYHYVHKYADPKYIGDFISAHKSELAEFQKILLDEYYDSRYDTTFLTKSAKESLTGLDYKIKKFDEYKYKNPADNHLKEYDTINTQEAPPYYIQAYKQRETDKEKTIRIVNNYSLDINLTGYVDENGIAKSYPEIKTINSLNKENNKVEIDIPKRVKYLLYKVNSRDSVYRVKIFNWKFPEARSPRMELLSKGESSILEQFISGSDVIIPAGNYTLKKPLVIPKGYDVEILAGVDIDLVNNSFILSYSPVRIEGEKESQVHIHSSDGTSMGFIVMQASTKSNMRYAVFDQLNALDYKDWRLTGAVTFYESDVDLDHVMFSNNRSEDALNIIRSTFNMKNCTFDNIYSDGFDSDFSVGKVISCNFRDLGNDALDFSGSKISIAYCTINRTGDKGISGGEKSQLKVKNVTIMNCNIGIASKDNSVVETENTTIKFSKYGLIAFNKKSEYKGTAQINSKNTKLIEITVPELIEKGSILIKNDSIVNGTKKDVADLFYVKN